MTVAAVLQVDLVNSPLGTRSRLADELCGEVVLRRTVARVAQVKSVGPVCVLCPDDQAARCEEMLAGTKAEVRRFSAGPAPWAALVTPARKWSLDAWRGGIGGTTHFDEYLDARLLDELLKSVDADVILSVPPAAPLFDSVMADRMIEYHRGLDDETNLVFTQAPPGVTGVLMHRTLVRELAEKSIPIGWVFGYKPDSPRKDLIFHPCCFEIPPELRYASGRLVADTQRATDRLTSLLLEGDVPDGVAAGAWLQRHADEPSERLPREVEIELTTDDPYPDALLRPRGSRVGPRGPMDPVTVDRVMAEMGAFDDSLVVWGGFGDPLRHREIIGLLDRTARARRDGCGPYGLAIRTSGVDLSDDVCEALVAADVDVVSVLIDAWSPELYGQLQAPGRPSDAELEAVLAGVERLNQCRQRRALSRPLVVPEMTKARDNVHELDAFYDGWLRRLGSVAISGHSHCAGQCEDRSVIRMAPLPRAACRRLASRCLVLADGRVVACDQDFNGRHVIGDLAEASLEAIWGGPAMMRIRSAHLEGSYDPTPLCAACDDWHRP